MSPKKTREEDTYQEEDGYSEENTEQAEAADNKSQAEKQKRSMAKQTFGRVASYCAIILLVSTAVQFAFSLLPLNLTDPSWHLKLVSGALASSPIILIAGLFLLIASAMDRQSRSLNQYMADYIRFTSFWSLFLLLLIPIQAYAGHKALNQQVEPTIKIVADLKKYLNGIRATNNEIELRQFLASIPNGPKLPERFNEPYATVKQKVLTNLQAKISAGTADIDLRKRSSTQTFALEALRNSIQAILMFLAFTKINKLRGIFKKSLKGFV